MKMITLYLASTSKTDSFLRSARSSIAPDLQTMPRSAKSSMFRRTSQPRTGCFANWRSKMSTQSHACLQAASDPSTFNRPASGWYDKDAFENVSTRMRLRPFLPIIQAIASVGILRQLADWRSNGAEGGRKEGREGGGEGWKEV